MPSPEWALFGCMVRERNLHSASMRRRVHGARAKSALGKHAFRPLLLQQPTLRWGNHRCGFHLSPARPLSIGSGAFRTGQMWEMILFTK
mmetsp:Transcript_48175/g.155365  ORF Transcript_48175/g.155365 Transcript_48175/m.155365 type:complete len:89 (-) Transcript_48175:164-430(-)